MSIKSFDNYAAVARARGASNVEVAGRYAFQAAAERRILADLIAKLGLEPEDSLLEIGCGPGNLLVPLSHFVARSAGIDNAAAIDRLSHRVSGADRITLHAGDFLGMEPLQEKFSKILVYSVIQYVDTPATVERFVRAALDLLAPGGRLLVGDLANRDKKKRFGGSSRGVQVAQEWSQLVSGAGEHPMSTLPPDNDMVEITDELVLGLMTLGRRAGFEAYLLPQSPELPFGNTREDLLFVAPA